jgi:D-arabinose 1-dehydrogenase-like Zn-dependent alcohol dehydrogenase
MGGIGHLATQFAFKMGFRVVVVCRGPGKVNQALKYGASKAFDSHNKEVDIVSQINVANIRFKAYI